MLQEDQGAFYHQSPEEVENFLDSSEYRRYMSTRSSNDVCWLIISLYLHVKKDVASRLELVSKALNNDPRANKDKSIAWLMALRRSMMDNETEIAVVIFTAIPYSSNFVSKIFDIDLSNRKIFLGERQLDRDAWKSKAAYIAVLKEFEKRDSSFFEAYMAYRLLMTTFATEFLVDLIALDKPKYLSGVVMWPDWVYKVPLDVDIMLSYMEWKYVLGKGSKSLDDAEDIMDFIDRFPGPYRMNFGGTIAYRKMEPIYSVMMARVSSGKYAKIFGEEEERYATISAIKEKISRTRIATRSDVDKLVSEIESGNTLFEPVRMMFASVIRGRFRYL